MVLSFFQCHQALEHNLWFSRQYNILCMVATEIGPNLVKASKLIRFTRAVSVFVRQIKVFGKANRPSICWCLRFQHWAGRLKVLFDWEEDNPRLTDDKILWNVGILNKRRRLHSCNKRGQAVRKKPKPNESIFVWTAALGFKSEPEHTDSTQSPFVFLHTTLTESGTTVHARTPTPPPARWLTAVVPVPENLCWQKLHLNIFFVFTSYGNVTFPNSVSTTSNRWDQDLEELQEWHVLRNNYWGTWN